MTYVEPALEVKEVTLTSGKNMLVIADDIGISQELDNKGSHEILSTSFIKTLFNPDMVIFDIGANIGYYALIEADYVHKVYAFEPVPNNVLCLKENIKKYQINNIDVFEIAFGNENKLTTMRTAEFSNSGTIMSTDDTSNWYENWFRSWYTNDIIVEQWTLDDYRKMLSLPIPNMIRMDVEGYEKAILEGAEETLKEMPINSYLFIEFHPPVFKDKENTMQVMIGMLKKIGFSVIWADGITEFKEGFVSWACNPENHCPHTFLIKNATNNR